MNEEKKLSKMLDEIFGDYISNETCAPADSGACGLENMIENMFLRKDIISQRRRSVNRYSNTKPANPIAPPYTKTSNGQNNFQGQRHGGYTRQAYIAKSICNQIYELFCVYDILIKSSRRFNASKRVSLKTTIMEIKPMAEYVYEKTANQKIYYSDNNLRFPSEYSALNFMERRINSILNDTAVLKNNTDDITVKRHLNHIQTLLSSHL